MSMHPQIVAYLESMASHGFRPFQELSATAARDQYLRSIAVRDVSGPSVARVVDHQAPGPGGPIPVRIYHPEGAPDAAPVLVYYHGGGHVVGNIDTHDAVCRDLANRAGCAVASVDYRLAPEHKFPAAAEDAYAALEWLVSEAGNLGLDPGRVAVGGDSAGGNLAAVVALMARDRDGPSIALQLLIYPVADYRCDTPSYTAYAEGFGSLHAATMHWFRDHYLRGPDDAADWRAAPLVAADLSGLPPACVLLAECDVLRDEGRAYAQRLGEAGVAVESKEYAGMIHGFFVLSPIVDAAGEAVDAASTALRRAFGGA